MILQKLICALSGSLKQNMWKVRKKLLRLELDLGGETRQVFAGINRLMNQINSLEN